MRIWKASKVAEELAADLLTERQKLTYFLFTACLLALVPLIRNAKPWTAYDNIRLLSVPITIFGYLACFDVNKVADDRRFIERVVILSVPLTFQMFALGLGVFIPIRIVVPSLKTSLAFWPVANAGLLTWFFWRLWAKFSLIGDLIRTSRGAGPSANPRLQSDGASPRR